MGVYVVFLFENIKSYSYLFKKITYTPCYGLVKKLLHKFKIKNIWKTI